MALLDKFWITFFLTLMSAIQHQVYGQCAITNVTIQLDSHSTNVADSDDLRLIIEGITTGAQATSVTWRRNGVIVDRHTQPYISFWDGGGESIVNTGPCESQMYRVALGVYRYLPGSYNYTVTNADTTSPLTSPVFQLQDPGPPTNIVLTQVNQNRVLATWTPPINFPEATYVVYVNTVNVISGGIAVTETTFTTDAFTINSNVTVRVRGTTGTYLSIVPAVSSTLTIKDVLPPAISVSSVSATSADLSLTQTTDSLSVDIYTVTLTSTTCVGVPTITQSSTSNTMVVMNLRAGIQYLVNIKGTNNVTQLSADGTTALITTNSAPSGSPGAPTVDAIFSTNVTISWMEVDCLDRNGAITNYIIQYGEELTRDRTINTHTNSTTHTITGLKPFTQYTFRVAGVNSISTGPFSNDSEVISTAEDTPVGSPGIPVATVIRSSSITLSWAPILPPDRNGVIIRYVIQYGERNTHNRRINTQSNATTYLVTGLRPFTLYSFSVAGVNKVNTGPFSAARAIIRTAEDRPTKVRNFQLTATLFSLRIFWEVPQPLNGILVHYTIQYTLNGTQKVSLTTNQNSFLISNLLPDELVSNITVTATTGGGEGPSVMADISTLDRPAMVRDIKVDILNGTSVRVSWNITGFQDISEFVVFHRETGVDERYAESMTSVQAPASSAVIVLVAGKQYVIEVCAMAMIDGQPLFGYRTRYGSVAIHLQENHNARIIYKPAEFAIAIILSVLATVGLVLVIFGIVHIYRKKVHNKDRCLSGSKSNEIEINDCGAYGQHRKTEPELIYDTVKTEEAVQK